MTGSRSRRRLPLHGEVERGEAITIVIDGKDYAVHVGETVATAMIAEGRRAFRRTARRDAPRGLYCGMGVCYDCLVVVDGRPNTRACMTSVRPGMRVDSQAGWSAMASETSELSER